MPTYRLTQRARRSLVEIWSYIAQDGEVAADRLIDQLVEGFRSLGQSPYIGRSRDDLGSGCRSFAVGQYVIIYRVSRSGVSILRVLHGKRDIAGLLIN